MRILIKGGRIVDPSSGRDGVGSLLIEDSRIRDFPSATESLEGDSATTVIDASGKVVAPGFIDLHTSLGEPGYEYKETIRTGSLAAAAGGFTTVVCTPETNPVNDNASVTEYILFKARTEGVVHLLPLGAMTKGNLGESLAEIGEMKQAGCVGITDSALPIMDAQVMRLALEYSKAFDVPVITNCRDTNLSSGGVINEGYISTKMGLRGEPAAAEEITVSRNLALADLTRTPIHISHLSTRAAVNLVREAKERGLPVTAEVAPPHFTLDETAIVGYDTNLKLLPPLRSEDDVEAVIEGLGNGTIDTISSNHSPHSEDEKKVEFDLAPYGISGLETCLGLSLELVKKNVLSLSQMIERLSTNPARVLGLNGGTLSVGSPADVVIFDPSESYTVDKNMFFSKGTNTPFHGYELSGVVYFTIVAGQIVYAITDIG